MSARFIRSARDPQALGEHGLVEVAFAGRSNVGKSSLLGTLVRRHRLFKTSATPGRTRALNLFAWEGFALVDLPGYGYAKLSKTERIALEHLLRNYFRTRVQLAAVVLILDARRDVLQANDQQMAAWILQQQLPLLLVLNKIDAIPKNRRQQQVRRIERALGVPDGTAVVFSAKSGEGRDELVARLQELRQPA